MSVRLASTESQLLRPTVVLYTLRAFAEDCHRLESLAIGIDADVTAPHTKLRLHLHLTSQFRRFVVFYSPPRDVNYISDSTVFPLIDDFEAPRWPCVLEDARARGLEVQKRLSYMMQPVLHTTQYANDASLVYSLPIYTITRQHKLVVP